MNPDHRYEIGVGRAGGRRQVFVRQRIGPHLEAVTASAPLEGTAPRSSRSTRPRASTPSRTASRRAEGHRPGRRPSARPSPDTSRPRWPGASPGSMSASTRPARASRPRPRPTSTGSTTRPAERRPRYMKRSSCHSPQSLITVTNNSLSPRLNPVVVSQPGQGVPALGYSLLMSGAWGECRGNRALPHHRRTTRRKQTHEKAVRHHPRSGPRPGLPGAHRRSPAAQGDPAGQPRHPLLRSP